MTIKFDLEVFNEQNCLPGGQFQKKVLYFKIEPPEGIAIKKVDELNNDRIIHYGLFATRSFKKEETVFSFYSNIIFDANKILNFPEHFIFEIEGVGQVSVSTGKHMLRDINNAVLFGFDALINHSCAPNTRLSFNTCDIKGLKAKSKFMTKLPFKQIATKDIAFGEEIRNNYLLYSHDLSSEGSFECSCGADDCVGSIKGFKYLSPEKQKEYASNVDEYFLREWGYEHLIMDVQQNK